jgi:DNA polymerase-3 subunit beta
MKLVIFAGSNDDSRYNLNSILFEVADGKLRLVATDGHRLSQLDTGIEVKSEDKKYIVPKKSAMAIMNFLKGKEGNILILLTPKNIYLDTPNATIRSRLVEGEYPDYTKVVPLGSFEPILVVLDDLKSSAGICNLMTSDRNRGVNIVVGAGSLDMSATHPDWGTAQNTIDVEYIGERVECILNGAYLTDALSAFAVDKILLEYRNKDAPVIFRSIQPTPTNYFSLIMPMRR